MALTVIELIKALAEFPPDLEVVVSSDAAGNYHHFLSERMEPTYAEKNGSRYGGLETCNEEDWYDWVECRDLDDDTPFPGNNCLVIGP